MGHAAPVRICDKGLVAPRDKGLAVRKSLLIPVALAALILAGASSASRTTSSLGPNQFVVGATEDQTLGFDDGGDLVYGQMTSHKLGAIRISVDYEPGDATTVQQEAQLERAITAADERGAAHHPVDLARSQHRRDGRRERRQEVRGVHRARRAQRSRRSPTS